MRRASEVEPAAAEEPAKAYCDPCREPPGAGEDEQFEDDAGIEAIKLVEDCQDLFFHLLCMDVRKAVPIPVWNELCRLEVRASHLLNSITMADDY